MNCGDPKKHGVDFRNAVNFDWETAIFLEDTRKAYGEKRFLGLGFIESRLHALVFTRRGDVIRVISLRKANKREEKFYGS